LKFQLGHSFEDSMLWKFDESHDICVTKLLLNDCKNECHNH